MTPSGQLRRLAQQFLEASVFESGASPTNRWKAYAATSAPTWPTRKRAASPTPTNTATLSGHSSPCAKLDERPLRRPPPERDRGSTLPARRRLAERDPPKAWIRPALFAALPSVVRSRSRAVTRRTRPHAQHGIRDAAIQNSSTPVACAFPKWPPCPRDVSMEESMCAYA